MGDVEKQQVTVKAVGGIGAVDRTRWNACAGSVNPFVSHEFLSALEESKSATAESGWGPYHLVVEDSDGEVLGAAPMYLKGHSYGEFVFDHAWAHAFEQAGGSYYPKLLIGVPFTPVTGPRLLVPAGPQPDRDSANPGRGGNRSRETTRGLVATHQLSDYSRMGKAWQVWSVAARRRAVSLGQ